MWSTARMLGLRRSRTRRGNPRPRARRLHGSLSKANWPVPLMTFVSIAARLDSKTMSPVHARPKGMVMTPTDRFEMTRSQLDAIAWKFLRSEFTGQIYADWPHRPAYRCLSPSLRTDRADQRRIRLQRVVGTRNGQHRRSLAQRSSSVAEHLGTTMTVIHKTPEDWPVSPEPHGLRADPRGIPLVNGPRPVRGHGIGALQHRVRGSRPARRRADGVTHSAAVRLRARPRTVRWPPVI